MMPKYNIEPIQQYFAGINLERIGPFNLNPAETIINVPRFVTSHLKCLDRFNGNDRLFRPFYDRLVILKKIIEEGQK